MFDAYVLIFIVIICFQFLRMQQKLRIKTKYFKNWHNCIIFKMQSQHKVFLRKYTRKKEKSRGLERWLSSTSACYPAWELLEIPSTLLGSDSMCLCNPSVHAENPWDQLAQSVSCKFRERLSLKTQHGEQLSKTVNTDLCPHPSKKSIRVCTCTSEQTHWACYIHTNDSLMIYF